MYKRQIFAFHGYPTLVHELTYRRHNKNLHVRGYKEEGTITTPFDMRVKNDIDRFHLVQDVVLRPVSYTHLAVYKRQGVVAVALNMYDLIILQIELNAAAAMAARSG